jgi:LPXTG-motif cell wall-anchored protein
LTVSGTGFAPTSQVQVTIQSTSVHLASVTTDTAGSFSVNVAIPESVSGQQIISATGTDPSGSVRVLSATIAVTAAKVPGSVDTTASQQGFDPIIFAIAGAGIVLVTGLLLLAMRRRRDHI